MRHIHRAAVTGLFAIWLAPLSAGAAGQAAGTARCASAPAPGLERPLMEDGAEQRRWPRGTAALRSEDDEAGNQR